MIGPWARDPQRGVRLRMRAQRSTPPEFLPIWEVVPGGGLHKSLQIRHLGSGPIDFP